MVENCTFTGNRNAVDDMSGEGICRNSIFYGNTLEMGLPQERYELDLPNGGTLENCFISGKILDPQKAVLLERTELEASDPKFTSEFAPQSPDYRNVGYRPITRPAQ